MTTIDSLAFSKTDRVPRSIFKAALSPNISRLWLILFIAGATLFGFLITGRDASSLAINADEDLTRLLRAMAALKAVIALGVAASILWRLGTVVSLSWLGAYAIACSAMFAGPGLIWNMAYVGAGALLLHGGLLASLLLFWRDPAVSERLSAMIAARRHALNERYSR
jgi:hypothetical protein